MTDTLTPASRKRIDTFVDWFIRSVWVEAEWNDGADRWLIDEDRAERCSAAAKDGCDGSTHAEVIEDWRNAFRRFMRSRDQWHTYERFEAAVNAHFDAVEQWHANHGSLHQEIG